MLSSTQVNSGGYSGKTDRGLPWLRLFHSNVMGIIPNHSEVNNSSNLLNLDLWSEKYCAWRVNPNLQFSNLL
jgi:hypothetical protein